MRFELNHMAELINLTQGQVMENEPMSRHSSYGVGGPADAFITPKNVADLSQILKFASSKNMKTYFIGSGSNILVNDSGISGLVISPSKALTQLSFHNGTIFAESGVMLGRMVKETIKRQLTGFEGLAGVPGTLGGAIMMNAGAFGHEISNYLTSISLMDMTGEIHSYDRNDFSFSYRQSSIDQNSFIVNAKFELDMADPILIQEKKKKASALRRSSQPLKFRSAGSVFKNPKSDLAAGYLIDQAGLKGYKVGDAEISQKHANFFVNHGNATASDIKTLIHMAQEKVYEKFEIKLELEIKTFGFEEREFQFNG